jgi:hypothetical protein
LISLFDFIPACLIISSSTNSFQIVSDLGVNQISKNNPIGLSVWPNPFTNKINFAVGNLYAGKLTDLKITDVLGKVVFEKKYTNKTELNESVELENLSSGIYFILVSNNNRSSYFRIIKN